MDTVTNIESKNIREIISSVLNLESEEDDENEENFINMLKIIAGFTNNCLGTEMNMDEMDDNSEIINKVNSMTMNISIPYPTGVKIITGALKIYSYNNLLSDMLIEICKQELDEDFETVFEIYNKAKQDNRNFKIYYEKYKNGELEIDSKNSESPQKSDKNVIDASGKFQ